MSGRAAVIIPAGGAGRRFGGIAKPLLPLAGEPLLLHALRPFLERADVCALAVVLPADVAADPPPWLPGLDSRITIVAGGRERSDSVRAGIDAVGEGADVLVVHDAARPLVTAALIERVMTVAYRGHGAVPALAASDTVHEIDAAGRILATPDRGRFRHAQTPQAFPRDVLVNAYREMMSAGAGPATDEAAMVAQYGGTVIVVDGDPANVKVTVPSDLTIAEALLNARTRL